jgi:hypothetical protein
MNKRLKDNSVNNIVDQYYTKTYNSGTTKNLTIIVTGNTYLPYYLHHPCLAVQHPTPFGLLD